MLTEPGDLDRRDLEGALEHVWGLSCVVLDYLPVGFGSHHWRAVGRDGQPRFVTVDDLQAGFQAGPDPDAAGAALDRAYRTAVALRDEARLDFVVAPLVVDTGEVVHRLSERYALTVFPFVQGESRAYGGYESLDARRRMGEIVGRLHSATGRVDADLPRRETFALPSRGALDEALGDLETVWRTGPFAEPTRALLAVNAADLESRLQEYDRLALRVRESAGSWVITHGEPHRANVIRAGDRLRLVDWDTTLLAPRERDLQMILDEDRNGWAEYVGVLGTAGLDADALELYRKQWPLAEIAIYVALFRRPHARTDDTAKSWRNLTEYLPRAAI